MTIGSKIKELRIRRGLTQDQIAAKLNMNRANFSHYERDTAIPPSDVLGRIADALNTTTDYLLGRSEPDIINEDIDLFIHELQKLPSDKQELALSMIKAWVKTMQEEVNARNSLSSEKPRR